MRPRTSFLSLKQAGSLTVILVANSYIELGFWIEKLEVTLSFTIRHHCEDEPLADPAPWLHSTCTGGLRVARVPHLTLPLLWEKSLPPYT
jgi:hypothetical protein